MTVTSDVNNEEFVGDGVALAFQTTIQAYNSAWMFGYVDNVQQSGTMVLNADQENDAGGIFTFDVAPPNQSIVSIRREVPLSQLVDFPDYGPFPARNNEDALDKITMALTQFLSALEGGDVTGPVNFIGPVNFDNTLTMAHEIGINFNNFLGNGPNGLGVFRFINDTAGNVLKLQRSAGGGTWTDLMVAPSAILDSVLFPEGASSGVEPQTDQDLTTMLYVDTGDTAVTNGYLAGDAALQAQIDTNDTDIADLNATKADITYVDSQDNALLNQIVANDGDIAALQTDKVAKAGDSMIGQLDTVYPPVNPSHATNVQWVQERVDEALGAPFFLGYYDASGNITPADGTQTGESYLISAGGTINLSDGVNPKVATAVIPNNRITWDFNVDTGSWVFIAAANLPASTITFANAGTNYASVDVQAALVEADATMFVHAAGSINEAVTGNKSFTSNLFMGNGRAVQLKGATDGADGAGALNMYTNGTDITLFEKRNAAGDTWIPVLNINAGGSLAVDAPAFDLNTTTFMANSIGLNFRNLLGEGAGLGANRILNAADNTLLIQHHDGATWVNAIIITPTGQVQIPVLDGFVDTTTDQSINGIKNWLDAQTVAINTRTSWKGQNLNGDISGAFSIYTDNGEITHLEKANAAGDTWLPVMQVLASGTLRLGTITEIVTQLFLDNNISIAFKNDAADAAGLGAKQIVNTGSNVLRILHHNGVDFQNSINVTASGRLDLFDAAGNGAATVDTVGTAVTLDNSIITRQKGDFRYGQLGAANVWGFNQTFNGLTRFDTSLIMSNNQVQIFDNSLGESAGLGSKRIYNDGVNIFKIEHHNGVDFQTAITVAANGTTQVHGNDGILTATFEVSGTPLTTDTGVVTREKGDARYALAGAAGVVAGTIIMWATGTPPAGYLLCNGATLDPAIEVGLFAVLGAIYGGDGITTFNLPDYRGTFLRGTDNGALVDPDAALRTDRGDGVGGDTIGSKQLGDLLSHTHTYDKMIDAGGGIAAGGGGLPFSGTSTSATGGLETRPLNTYVNYVIKT